MFPLIDEGQTKPLYQGSMAELAYAADSQPVRAEEIKKSIKF